MAQDILPITDFFTPPNGLTDDELTTRAYECRKLAASTPVEEIRLGLLHIAEQYEALLVWRRGAR